MNDTTDAERAALGARLTGAIPSEPDLTGLAARAETGARRTRRVRRAGIAAAAAVAVVAVIAVPQLVDSQPEPGGPEPASPVTSGSATPGSCVPQSALDHQDFRSGTAVWVRACPSFFPRYDMAMPGGALRGGAAALVSSWQRIAYQGAGLAGCPTARWPGVDVQVGFADGTVSEVGVGSCQGLISPGNEGINASPLEFGDVVATAIERQNDARFHAYNPPGPPRECPRTLADPAAMNVDGASAKILDDSGALLDLSAVESLVCRYEGRHLTQTRRHLEPERLLLASGSGWFLTTPGNRADLGHTPVFDAHAGEYLVAICDKTNTWRTFTVTGRYGSITFYRGHGRTDVIGYAGEPMLQALGVSH